jgi:nucleoside-diphosphate-sugar epimerase
VYGTPDTVPITEDHPLKGQSPYSATKIAADKLCEAWACSFGVNVTVLRPFNTFGPRQSYRAVIPTILAQGIAGRPVELGSLHPVRDFLFVEDTVAGMLAFAEWEGAPGALTHIGTGSGVSIGQVVKVAGEVLGRELEVQLDEQRVRPDASEVQLLICDASKARAELDWEPQVDLNAGLARTAEWIERNLQRYRPDVYAV